MKKKLTSPILISALFMISLFFPLNVTAEPGYPKKPINMIVVWKAGGGADTATRIFTKYFEKTIGQKVIVQNITGGSASIGYIAAKDAKPDGYTLVCIQGDLPKFKPMGMAPISVEDYDILDGFAYQSPVVVVKATSPWNTIQEFVEDCKNNPGQRSIGISDIGGTYHQPLVLWEELAGFKSKAIVHEGSPQQMASLLGGHIDANLTWVRPNIPYVKNGEMKFLAYMSAERMDEYPTVPTMKELGWDIVWQHPYGVGGPKGMPADVKKVISEATQKVWSMPEFQKDLDNLGLVLFKVDSVQYSKHMLKMQADMTKALKIIKNN